MVDFLTNEPAEAPATILLAHGAGAAMYSPGMTMIAEALAGAGLAVIRFEFAYMANRREGTRRPPPRAERLMSEYIAAVELLEAHGPLIIGGKSMGGRVASMVADELYAQDKIAGLLCLGYPFHPTNKPETLRTAHLKALETPTLIFQGTRDPFGTEDEVPAYDLSEAIRIHWLPDGDHDLKPRKRISGFSHADHMATMACETLDWTRSLG